MQSRPLKVLRQVTDANGFEAYKQLHNLYAPRTKGRAMALLSALMGFPAFQKDKTSLEHPGADKSMERLSGEYRKASGQDINNDILLSTLLRALPKPAQQNIQLSMDEGTAFSEVKEKVMAYERVSHAWNRDRLLADIGATSLGAVTS